MSFQKEGVDLFYRFTKNVVWLFLHVLFRFKVTGSVPKEGPLLICANHTSYFDPAVVAASCNRPLTFMAKKELFSSPLFGGLIRRLGAFPVDRDAGGLQAMKTTFHILKQEKATVIFPEGKRNKTGKKIPPKPGVVLIAQRAQVPVVPVGICGSYRPFSRVKVTFGTPITYEAYAGQKLDATQLDQLANQLMDQILSLAEAKC